MKFSVLQRLSEHNKGLMFSMFNFFMLVQQTIKVLHQQIFGEASGLQTNLQKSYVIPMHCEGKIVETVNTSLQCTTSNFPTTYLGLSISEKKLRRSDLLAWIEKNSQ